MSRRDAAERLGLGLVIIPVYGLLLVALLVLAVPVWLLNNVFGVLTGRGLSRENSRFGYLIYWSQSNLQWVVTGRGRFQALP
jgi:hypothetical protein